MAILLKEVVDYDGQRTSKELKETDGWMGTSSRYLRSLSPHPPSLPPFLFLLSPLPFRSCLLFRFISSFVFVVFSISPCAGRVPLPAFRVVMLCYQKGLIDLIPLLFVPILWMAVSVPSLVCVCDVLNGQLSCLTVS